MAISGPASFVPTTEEFVSHWTLADAALGAGNEIVLAGGANLATLSAKKTALVAKRLLLQTKLTLLELARGDIEGRKIALLDLFNKLTDRVRALFAGSKYERALPGAPGIGESQGNFTDPLDTAASLWSLINADPALADIVILGVTQTQFAAQIADLKTAYTTRTDARTVADVTREERNDVQDEIYVILKNYRQALPSHFASGHALIDSLPRLTPEPGATPEPVVVNGVWVPAENAARLSWTGSQAPDFAEYEIRMTPGPDYSSDDDVVVGNILDIGVLELVTDAGLTAPGVTATYKVFVKTTTGNERGSNTVAVTRPP